MARDFVPISGGSDSYWQREESAVGRWVNDFSDWAVEVSSTIVLYVSMPTHEDKMRHAEYLNHNKEEKTEWREHYQETGELSTKEERAWEPFKDAVEIRETTNLAERAMSQSNDRTDAGRMPEEPTNDRLRGDWSKIDWTELARELQGAITTQVSSFATVAREDHPVGEAYARKVDGSWIRQSAHDAPWENVGRDSIPARFKDAVETREIAILTERATTYTERAVSGRDPEVEAGVDQMLSRVRESVLERNLGIDTPDR